MNSLYDEFRIVVHSIWQRRWLALAIAWGICVLGWLIVALIPNSYQSEATVRIETQDVLAGKIGITPSEQRRMIERVQQTITSSENLEKVVRSTELGNNVATPREMEGTITGLRTNIKVVSAENNMVTISATASQSNLSDAQNAQLSRDIVQKLVDIFREENISGGRTETSETLKFLEEQLAEREKELEIAEQKRVEFEQNNIGALPGIGSASQRMEMARSELSQVDSQLMSAQSALAAIRGQLAGTPRTISTPSFGGGGGGAQAQLSQVQGQLAAARANGKLDNHPDVVALKSQIAALRQQAASEPNGGSGGFQTPNPAYSSLQSILSERQANVAALSARKAALQAEMNNLTGRLSAAPGITAEYARINRDYDVLKTQYDKLLKDREDIRLRGQVQTETDAVKVDVLKPPLVPRAPEAPNRPMLLFAVLILGIGGGIGAVFALSQIRTSYATPAKLEKASGLPVLGSISHVVTAPQRALQKQKMKYFAGASAALAGVFVLLLFVEFFQRGMVA